MTSLSIRESIQNYFNSLNALDEERYLNCFAENAVVEDPVGAEPKRTREERSEFIQGMKKMARQAHFTVTFVHEMADWGEAKAVFKAQIVTKKGRVLEFQGIDDLAFDGKGLIKKLIGFWDGSIFTSAESKRPNVEEQQWAMAGISGMWIPFALGALVKAGIPDLLANGEKSVSELATLTGCHEVALYRTLRAMSSMGYFVELENKSFLLTGSGRLFQTLAQNPHSLAAMCLFQSAPSHLEAWGNFSEALKSNHSSFESTYKCEFFDYLLKNPEELHVFQEAMLNMTKNVVPQVLKNYDFKAYQSICDIGGGTGLLLREILQSLSPQIRGAVFDLQDVVAPAAKGNSMANLSFVGGSFFETAPKGHDLYLIKHILHDWDDESCLKILARIRENKAANAKLLILDSVVSEGGNGFEVAKLLDLEMLVMTHGGYERTKAQWESLLGKAGYKILNIGQVAPNLGLIETI